MSCITEKERFDNLWFQFKQDIEFKNRDQHNNVKKVIKSGDKKHLYYQFFYLYQKLKDNNSNINTNINTNNNSDILIAQKDREINDLNKELKECYNSIDNINKRNISLEQQLTNNRTEISNLKYKIKILKGEEKPSMFDEIPKKQVDDSYDPYSIGGINDDDDTLDDTTTLKDFTGTEISNAKYTYGIDFWDSLDSDLKIQCLLQLRC